MSGEIKWKKTQEAGIQKIRAELLPEDKVLELIERYGKVKMVVNGINNVPVVVADALWLLHSCSS